LSACLVRGVRVIAGAPFNAGILAGGVRYGHLPAQPEVVARVQSIDEVCRAFGVPLGTAVLQFPIGHPAVSFVLPAPRNASQAHACSQWMGLAIPGAFWTSLEERGFIPHPVPVAEERAA
jgi:D-threo-aldose 1-dehydrogenase